MKIRWLGDPTDAPPPGWEIVSDHEIRAVMGAREGTVLCLGRPIEADLIDLAIVRAGTPYEAAFRIVEQPRGCRQYIKRLLPKRRGSLNRWSGVMTKSAMRGSFVNQECPTTRAETPFGCVLAPSTASPVLTHNTSPKAIQSWRVISPTASARLLNRKETENELKLLHPTPYPPL